MVKSKYNIWIFSLIIFGFIFINVLPFVVWHTEKNIKHPHLFLLYHIFSCALSWFLLYKTFQNCPRVTFDTQLITVRYVFNSKVYGWSSIKDIYLSRKESYWGQPAEASSIIFENGEKLIVWDQTYSNIKIIRSLISQKAGEKIRDPRPNIISKNLMTITRRKYSGNMYTSSNTLMLAGMTLFMLILIFPKFKADTEFIIFIFSFVTIFYFLLGTQMNYFLIDDGCLIIRNHYFPWTNRIIRLGEIAKIDMETPYNRSTALRVITNDFTSKMYGAGSLRDKNWNELFDDLKFIGIPIER